LKKGEREMRVAKKKEQPKKLRVQIQVRTEIVKALRKRAVDELKTVSKLLTEWVESWKETKK
jgi:hypothetical protein